MRRTRDDREPFDWGRVPRSKAWPARVLGDRPAAASVVRSRVLVEAAGPDVPGGAPRSVERRRPSPKEMASRRAERQRASTQRRRSAHPVRGLAVVVVAVALSAVALTRLHRAPGNANTYPPPSEASLAAMTVPERIVAIAESQVGYRTDPASSYCNKFSAHWDAGTGGCPSGERAEEWCADFAAWAWQRAGVSFIYGYVPGEIDGAAASFYEWGVANGEWHPATSGSTASPGDVAVYGLFPGARPSAVHVAVVTKDPLGQAGPDVVNGDGNRTGFSLVETETDEVRAGASQGDSVLAGYVSPP